MALFEVTDESFQTQVLEAQVPVLVDFWATWCAPCRMVAPILEELAREYEGRLDIAKVDVDRCPVTAQMFRVQSIPTLALFHEGRPIQAVQGALPKPALVRMLEESLPSAPDTPLIKSEDLAARMKAGLPLAIFDLRDPRDFSRSHLRHAQCAPVAELPDRVDKLAPGTTVVLYDRTGEGALEAATDLAGQVRVSVVALEKGILEWEGDGFETFSDREEAALDAS